MLGPRYRRGLAVFTNGKVSFKSITRNTQLIFFTFSISFFLFYGQVCSPLRNCPSHTSRNVSFSNYNKNEIKNHSCREAKRTNVYDFVLEDHRYTIAFEGRFGEKRKFSTDHHNMVIVYRKFPKTKRFYEYVWTSKHSRRAYVPKPWVCY